MPGKKGTIETILLELSKALQQIANQPAGDLLQSLGIALPVSISSDSEFTNSYNTLSGAISNLPSLSQSLLDAIEDEDIPEIILKSKDLALKLKDIFTAIDSLSGVITARAAALPAEERDILTSFASALPGKLVDHCIVTYIELRSQVAAQVLSFLGVLKWKITEEYGTVGLQVPYTEKKLQLSQLQQLVSDPINNFKTRYDWGNDSFDAKLLFEVLKNVIEQSSKGIADILSLDHEELLLETYIFSLQRNGLTLPPSLNFELAVPFGDPLNIIENPELPFPWTQQVTLNAQASANLKGSIKPPFAISFEMPAETYSANLLVETATSRLTEPFIIIGSPAVSRLEAANFKMRIGASAKSDSGNNSFDSSIGFDLSGLKLIVDLGESDGFIQKSVPVKQLASEFDVSADWSVKNGLNFRGSGGLELAIPTHIELGPVKLTQAYFTLSTASGPFQFDTTAAVRISLGPITAVIEKIGLRSTLSFPPNNSGNLGPLQLDIGFKAPSGVGLVVDAGGIKGGGFLDLDPERGEYFGALELEFKDLFSLKAFGIINTKMPDGSKGFSLLIVITAEFTPLQLGFGFTLNGVGGLLGVNRTVKVDVLREGLKTNAIKSILFPENVVANISRIISDVKQVFPPQQGYFLIAPMAKIGWGTPTLITIELGLLIEIPSARLIILGVLRALLPDEDKPLLKLQVNFMGELDFENKTISFDALLYDSSLLTFTLEGQMALRIAWGENKVLALSVGGFHPAFKEIPKGLENMRRITIGLVNTSDVRITIQNYFAVTSNTVQFGARAELYAAHGSWNVYGFVYYDVLFQFKPFMFIADFGASVALRRNESVIMGISVNGTLTGTSPWDVKGSASVSFFFFSVSVPFHKRFGLSAVADITELIDLLQMLTDLINDNRSWTATIPEKKNLHVTIKDIPVKANLLTVHPFGVLNFSQRLVPLGIDIDKFGTKVPKDVKNFSITTINELDPEIINEQFAAANFLKMEDSEKLSRPSFESMKSGFSVKASESLQAPMVINKSVDYEFSYLGREKKPKKDRYNWIKDVFIRNAGAAAIAVSPLSYTSKRESANAPAKMVVDEEKFVVAQVSDMKLFDRKAVAASYTEANQYYQNLIRNNPVLKDQLQVLSVIDINPN